MKVIVHIALAGILLALTVEILIRRWAWQQLPTQISSEIVYTIIAINLVTLFFSAKYAQQITTRRRR